MSLRRELFGHAPDGTAVERFSLVNSRGSEARLLSWGATLQALRVPDAAGRLGDVTLGFESLEGYLGTHPHVGGVIGRYANRIAGARFPLDGRELVLAANEPPNHLHGGVRGFDAVPWQARALPGAGQDAVAFRRRSADGEEGYPGNLDVLVTYTLSDANELRIEYEASSDAPTVVNLTFHGYFNLADAGASSILDHELELAAHRFTPVGEGRIPSGELDPVAGTPLDFTSPRAIGERIDELPGGYDHNFALDAEGKPALAARLRDPRSGRVMEVFTSEPGLQLYSGNGLDGSLRGPGGEVFAARRALCLEAQHFPDSPNQPGFPSTVLRPGQRYRQTTIHRFPLA